MRVAADSEFYARVQVENEDGDPEDASSTPTVAVTNGAGTAVAGVGAVSSDGDTGAYKAQVPAQATLDTLTATWTATVGGLTRTYRTSYSIVKDRLVPLSRLRSELGDLSGPALRLVADAVESWFTRALGYPPLTAGLRKTFTMERQSPRLIVPGAYFPQSVYAVTVDDYVYTVNDLANVQVVDGYLVLDNYAEFTPGRYTIHLAHGLPADEDLRRAAARFARYVSQTNNLPDRARRILTQETEIWLSMPSPEAPTGIPEVDAVIIGNRMPAFA